MLSDSAKIEIISVIAGCFVASVAFLICLVCPCPLRAAVNTCVERRGGRKKPLRGSNMMDGCSCCPGCCIYESSARRSSQSSTRGEYKSDIDAAATHNSRIWDQKRLASEPRPSVTMTFSVSRQPDCLVVHLFGAEGTPGPMLGLCHCNFAKVQLVESPDSGRRSEMAEVLQTGVVYRTVSPVFNETLILPLMPETSVTEGLSLLVQCLDYDRFSRERVIGEVRVPLPDELDQLVQYNSLVTEPPQIDAGELLVALHYMPTSERLRVILLKAKGVYAPDGSVPNTYVHILLLLDGDVVFKYRTRIFDEATNPVFNEPVSIDLPRRRLSRVNLIVSVLNCQLRRRVRPDLDRCLGQVVFSSVCYGSGRAHWVEMIGKPRTPLACWHRLS